MPTEKWCKPEPEQAAARGSGKAASVRRTSTDRRYETSTLKADDELCSARQDHTRRVEWADVCGQCRTIRSRRQQCCRRGVDNHTGPVEWATVWPSLGSRDRWRSCSREANSGRARQPKARSGSDVVEELVTTHDALNGRRVWWVPEQQSRLAERSQRRDRQWVGDEAAAEAMNNVQPENFR